MQLHKVLSLITVLPMTIQMLRKHMLKNLASASAHLAFLLTFLAHLLQVPIPCLTQPQLSPQTFQ